MVNTLTNMLYKPKEETGLNKCGSYHDIIEIGDLTDDEDNMFANTGRARANTKAFRKDSRSFGHECTTKFNISPEYDEWLP